MMMRRLLPAVAFTALGLTYAQAQAGTAMRGAEGSSAAPASLAGGGTVGRTVTAPIVVTPKDMSWKPGPAALPRGAQAMVLEGDPATPGALFTVRLKLPANYTISPHWHAADEHVTVVSGTFAIGHGEKLDAAQARDLPAGSFFVMPAKHVHFATTRSEAIVQLHAVGPWSINYVNPADDPRGAGLGGAGPGNPSQPGCVSDQDQK
jgi:quercetin dioxygenase-like cupin family protein